MEEERDYHYVKRSQKDYSMFFKISVVREIERGLIGHRAAMLKYAKVMARLANGGGNMVPLMLIKYHQLK